MNLRFFALLGIIFIAGSIFAVQANAQYQGQYGSQQNQIPRTPVNGAYSNSDFGVQITLPDGWNGFEMKRSSGTTSVMAFPGGMPTPGQRPPVMMTISMQPKTATSSPQYMPQRLPQNETCNTDSTNMKTINTMNVNEVIVDCTGPMTMKAKYEIAQTDSAYIVLGFRANPSSGYDSQVATFDSAVNTLQVANAIAPPAVPEFPIAILVLIVATFSIVVISRKTHALKL
ncbi:MAG: PEFG-CTERM sorting domain-containing protein [Thaumarchaeota archaeon]|nr:PEFG-CTERM sorting domain-containing protein [Nitrososphaerota archaeon]